MKTGFLLINLGTPSSPTPKAIKQYLIDFLQDKRVVDLNPLWWRPLLKNIIAPRRARKVAQLYQSIWMPSGSPLLHYSLALQQKLAARSTAPIMLCMTYGEPSIDRALTELQAHGVNHLVVLPLFPQYSSTTTAAALDALAHHLTQHRRIPAISFMRDYADNPYYISALAQSIESAFDQHGKPDCLVISYHGLPIRYCRQGDDYYERCQLTTDKLVQCLGLAPQDYCMTFQSRFGREPWLTPYTDHVLQQLPKQGKQHIQIVCPGFAVDCLETLEEIAKTNKALFLANGGRSYYYIPALNASESHIELWQDIVASWL